MTSIHCFIDLALYGLGKYPSAFQYLSQCGLGGAHLSLSVFGRLVFRSVQRSWRSAGFCSEWLVQASLPPHPCD